MPKHIKQKDPVLATQEKKELDKALEPSRRDMRDRLEGFDLTITSSGFVEIMDLGYSQEESLLCDLVPFIDEYRREGDVESLNGLIIELLKIKNACNEYVDYILGIDRPK